MKNLIEKVKNSNILYYIKNIVFCMIAAVIIAFFIFIIIAGIYILILYLFNLK